MRHLKYATSSDDESVRAHAEDNNNNNLSCGNPQPEAIGHTRTCLQPESGGRHYAQSAASSTGK